MNRATAFRDEQGAKFSAPAVLPRKKGPQSASEIAPLGGLVIMASEDFRLQTKEAIGLALSGFDRDEISGLTGISESRLDNVTRETGNKNLFAFEVPAVCAAIGNPELLRFLAQQVGCGVDLEAVVRLGQLARDIAVLQKEYEQILSEVA